LGDGYRLEAGFIIWEENDVLQAPASALFRHGRDDWAVFVVEGGVAKHRAVEIGRNNGLVAQITNGLKEGELVITHPDDNVRDGTKVKSREGR
jgi:HlyD family secretion protein